MSPDGKTGPSIELVLRKRIDELVQAIRDKDLERVLAFYAPDVMVFDEVRRSTCAEPPRIGRTSKIGRHVGKFTRLRAP